MNNKSKFFAKTGYWIILLLLSILIMEINYEKLVINHIFEWKIVFEFLCGGSILAIYSLIFDI